MKEFVKSMGLLCVSIPVLLLCGCAPAGHGPDNYEKARIVVVTDLGGIEPGVAFDPDDTESMLHLLVCSNLVDIEGIVTGMAWTSEPLRNGVKHVNALLDSFGEVLPNLMKHSAGYPSLDYLKSVVKQGPVLAHMDGVGEGKDTPGSEHIISVIDKDDPRPVWLTTWAGMSPIAQALWKVKNTRTEAELQKFISKIRIYDVLGQDDCGAWVAKNFPEILYIRNTRVYGWTPDDEWFSKNVQDRKPLGLSYPSRIWSWEGDTPGFLYFLANGLNFPEHPDYGGWGGRFKLEKTENVRGMHAAFNDKTGKDEMAYAPYYMVASTEEGVGAIVKWKDEILNDFAARMIWSCTPEYDTANHHPRAVIGRDNSLKCIYTTTDPGKTLRFDASASNDPDGDNLHWNWSIYKEAGSCGEDVVIDGADSASCQVFIPGDASAKTIHLILKLTDDGTPALTSYRRIVININ